MDWRDWFGWRFQVCVCVASIVALLFVYLRRRRLHPWYQMVIMDVLGLAWCLFWGTVAFINRDWFALVLWPLLLIWLGRQSLDIWRKREVRHVPVERP